MNPTGRAGFMMDRVSTRPARLARGLSVGAPRRRLHVARSVETMQKLDFTKLQTEEQFLGAMALAGDAGVLPDGLLEQWKDFYSNYKAAVVGSGVENGAELALEVQKSIADRVFNQFVDPYSFPSFHERILEPYNYYEFGQRYVGSLIDFDKSVVGNLDRWDEIDRKIKAGENVVLVANHQTEADPGVFAHMLAKTHPDLAENVIYVAGDRVVTDPMCKPFSMGRNLFCVHSKKHMDDVPELKKEKMATNRKTLVVMSRKLSEGGLLLWIAPSGGRDRPDENGEWLPNDFDPTAVELMRKLCLNAKKPGHIYPMAMVSWNMMPPPSGLSKTIGERRLTYHVGVGISVAEELNLEMEFEGLEEDDTDAKQKAFSELAHDATVEEYKLLDAAIASEENRAKMPQFKQPWLSE